MNNSKRPVSKIDDDITTTALSNRVVINAITGLKMNHINPGFRKTLEWKGSIELPEAQSSCIY